VYLLVNALNVLRRLITILYINYRGKSLLNTHNRASLKVNYIIGDLITDVTVADQATDNIVFCICQTVQEKW
jgi:hypothetical protein